MSVYSLTKGTITKVATSVTSRLLRNLSRDTQFLAMEKATGETAPTAADIANEGYYIFTDDFLTEKFNFDSLSDIYIMAMNGDGKIRVDSPGKPRISSMPYLYDISEGNVDGHVPFSKLGYTSSLTAAANTDLWSYAPTQPVYLFPTAAMRMEVLSSDNTADIGTIIKSGTSTGGSLTTLIDTAKDFTAATAVAVGDAVILDLAGTSPEYGYVTAVTSATQLTIAGGFSRGEDGKTALERFQESNILQNLSKDDIAEWLTKNIQDSFIFGSYDRLIKHIFEFVDIPNFSDAESWGNTISGVSAGYRLLGFLFLCNQTFRIWQEGKRQEIDLINAYTELLSGNEKVKSSMNELEIISNRILPKNVLENAQIAGMLKGLIPNSDLIKMFPEIVSDVDGALDELEDQLENESKRLMDSMTEPNTTGENKNGMSDKEETDK